MESRLTWCARPRYAAAGRSYRPCAHECAWNLYHFVSLFIKQVFHTEPSTLENSIGFFLWNFCQKVIESWEALLIPLQNRYREMTYASSFTSPASPKLWSWSCSEWGAITGMWRRYRTLSHCTHTLRVMLIAGSSDVLTNTHGQSVIKLAKTDTTMHVCDVNVIKLRMDSWNFRGRSSAPTSHLRAKFVRIDSSFDEKTVRTCDKEQCPNSYS